MRRAYSHIFKMLLNFLFLLLSSSSAWSITYTFSPAGATGTAGPSQVMINTAYTGTTLAGQVTSTSGIQTWVVPATGTYLIEAYGAQGYGGFGGRGAHISGEFNLTAGDTLKILVGQEAPPYLNFPASTYNHQFGGGGGSFVTLTDNTPLVVAGGGGGNHNPTFLTGADGQITNNGANGAGSFTGTGGVAGAGGQDASSADAGAGLLTNGAGIAGGIAFVNGGAGGFDEGFGGFGGGGGTSSWNNYRGGGGGGYSGGGGGNNSGSCCAAGGGGGSFNSGTNPTNLAGVQLDDGLVRITTPVPAATQYTVGGNVTGLASGNSVELQNNATDDLTVSSNTGFTFATALASSSAYAVTVLTQPTTPSQTCVVTNGTSGVGGITANVTNVAVACTTNTYSVGGTITGLPGDVDVVLQNNGGDDLTVSANGNFTFSTELDDGTDYEITILSSPGYACFITNGGTGTLGGADVNNISINCISTAPVPTLSEWALMLLTFLLLLVSVSYSRKRQG